jgi:tryptophan synthase beta chain
MSTTTASETSCHDAPATIALNRGFAGPDALGRYGSFGGRFVPETLMDALNQLAEAYEQAKADREFQARLSYYLTHYVGRPSPLFHAERLTKFVRGAALYLKREDLNHTGAHKINNAIGQVMLARRMNKTRVIAETGAGQHGVATATACALFGLECTVYMGEEDIRRQKLNVFNMKTLGAKVVPVSTGSRTLRDATNEAMRDWMGSSRTTHYTIGSVVGPHPFPMIVRDFQSVIGREARAQCLEQMGRLPEAVVACVGGGSNAAGMFAAFLEDAPVELIGAEAGGRGLKPGEHASSLTQGRPGVLHGSFSYVLQDEEGQTLNVHSISAGLDYPGVGPELSYWKETGRVRFESITDGEALEAYHVTARHEGILPALESGHALAQAFKEARRLGPGKVLAVCLSGRGDKDAYEIARLRGEPI